MKHLRKAIALLVTVLILVFVAPRLLPTSSALDMVGFYPKSNEQSTLLWANQPVQYVEPTLCASCHNNNFDSWTKSKHSSVNCEDCHGPAASHIGTLVKLEIDTSREACGTCHGKAVGRPISFPQVDLAQHNAVATCVTCHNPHSPTVSAKPTTVPHDVNGRADCLACHKAGGLKPVSASHAGRANSSCLSCHRSKQG